MTRSTRLLSLLLLLLGLAGHAGAATIYYVATDGADTNNGTSALTPWAHHPWDALATDTADGTALGAGDVVYMKKGQVWWDCALTADDGGSAASQIVTTCTDSFGSGANPILSGSYDTTGWDADWTDAGGGIYSRASITTQPNVAVYNTTILTKNTATPTTPGAGQYGWAANVLYVHLAGDANPASATLWRVGKRNYVALIQADYVTLKDLTCETGNTNVAGIVYIDTQTGVVLDGLTCRYGMVNAIYADTPVSCEVKNCTLSQIQNSNGTNASVRMLYVKSSNASSYHDNTITGGYAGFETSTGATGTNSVSTNTISGQSDTTAVYGISIDAGTGWEIEDNAISNLTSGATVTTVGIFVTTASNTISGNTLTDIGTSNNLLTHGIYVSANGNTISGNTISTTRYQGITIQGNTNTVSSNVVTGCGYRDVDGVTWLYYGNGGNGNGIALEATAAANTIQGNSVSTSYCGISLSITGGAGGNVVRANCAWNQVVNGIGDLKDGNPTNRNLFYNNTVYHNPNANNNPAYSGHAFHAQDVGNGSIKASFANNCAYTAVVSNNAHSFFVSQNAGTVSVYVQNNCWSGVAGANLGYLLGGTKRTAIADWISDARASAIFGDLAGTQATAESGTIGSNPLFVSLVTPDLHLQAGSPCINAGTDLGDGTAYLDYDGRNQDRYGSGWEIGAYVHRQFFGLQRE